MRRADFTGPSTFQERVNCLQVQVPGLWARRFIPRARIPTIIKTIRLIVLTLSIVGNALSLLGQTTIWERARYDPNNASGANNPDFTYGSGFSSTLSSIKSTAFGLPGAAAVADFRTFFRSNQGVAASNHQQSETSD
jgi:hypothetical protein